MKRQSLADVGGRCPSLGQMLDVRAEACLPRFLLSGPCKQWCGRENTLLAGIGFDAQVCLSTMVCARLPVRCRARAQF